MKHSACFNLHISQSICHTSDICEQLSEQRYQKLKSIQTSSLQKSKLELPISWLFVICVANLLIVLPIQFIDSVLPIQFT